jgi:glycosyltransferase involved in cell wall biosynthesis
MLLSIIIPAYNAENYLDECLASCFHQGMQDCDYELIIINDGSSDGTLAKAQEWAAGHSNIKIISQENKGLSLSRNSGIEASKGDYIMFLDSDDKLVEDSLVRILTKCRKNDLDMLRICAADMIDGHNRRRFIFKDTDIAPGRDLLKDKFQVCAPFAAYKREFLIKNSLRFYPGIYHEDNLFTPTAYYLAEKVGTWNRICYLVRQTPGSITRSSNYKRSTDILKVIEQLEKFSSEMVEDRYRKYFDKQISDCLNVCFKNACGLETAEKKKVVNILYEQRATFIHFTKSPAITHKIEGTLLRLFPRQMLSIYKILNSLR